MRQAEAEGRRAMAVAFEQEMKARVQEMQAKVIEAQAEVPLAISQAFRDGNLGVMDFYRMQNIESDTSIAITSGAVSLPYSDPRAKRTAQATASAIARM